MSIGETLAKEREQAGLTVTQVSLQTRIRETVIRAIERDDFTLCGGNFYARGHIRSISRVIGIDPEPLVRDYDESHGGAPAPVSAVSAFEPEKPVAFRERRSPNWSAAMALALVAVVVYAVITVVSGDKGGEHRSAQQVAAGPGRSVTPSPAATKQKKDPIAAAPRKNVELQVKARRTTWINVRGDKGKSLFSGMLHTGDTQSWTAKKKISILIGNGDGVRLTVNGKDLGAPDQGGGVVRLSFTPSDPEAG
ncbi:helix-turn-helix domain-containing protein [Actinomadura barringtoniae]|uniref:Helix-turn-helix domain-containing protein n=1 Tax=Actinomadura barringtoniae TaxID=1427535 RepID=A0A939PCC9_9ACTN|nr:helix-turn-helix domain-containing protein [Actinomadura barringtoniae]MBO2446659.1 helix-turn-helix domain-containing protein [Actinomadura barringtoniae]